MFTYPYQIIKKRLETISELREVDWYLEQDSISDKSAWLFAAPIAFIEIVPLADIIVHGNKAQSMEVDVNIILLTENVMDSGKRMNKTSPTDHMVIFDSINQMLQGFNSKLSYLTEFASLLNTTQDQRIITSLNRQSPITAPHKIRKSMMKSMQSFRTIIYDHSACKKYTKPTPSTSLQIDIQTI